MARRWIRVAAVAAVLVATSITGVIFYIDRITRTAIEVSSTYALGLDTSLESARIGLLSGSFRLTGLEVANPPGFENPRFLRLGEAQLDLDMGTLQQPTVIVQLFAIRAVEVDLDKQRGKANYNVILDNLARFESEEVEPDPTPEADAGPGKRFVIQELVIRDVVAHVRAVEGVPQIDVIVPEVRMRNLGGEGQPLTAAQVTDVIVKAVLASIAKAGAGLLGGVGSALSSGLGKLAIVSVDLPEGGQLAEAAVGAVSAGANAVTDAVSAGSDAAGDALEAGRGAAEDAGEAVKGLGEKLFGDD